MQAACVAGGADARIQAALLAGCDMGLVCNDRTAARLALSAIQDFPLPDQQRLERMRGKIPDILPKSGLELGTEWQQIKQEIEAFKANSCH